MAKPYIDGHCHLNSPELRDDVELRISEAVSAGLGRMMVVGSDFPSSVEALALAEKFGYLGVRAAIGVHPHEADSFSGGIPGDFRAIAGKEGVLAIGEIGLDYHYDLSSREVQREVMSEQMAWAWEIGLPVIFHVREAFPDFFSLVKERKGRLNDGVVHCFSGTLAEAKACLDMGFYLGFGGMITFKKADEVRECLAYCPSDRVILETDSPWLAPVPFRGKTNSPSLMPLIYRAAAEITGRDLLALTDSVWENGVNLYKWSSDDVRV